VVDCFITENRYTQAHCQNIVLLTVPPFHHINPHTLSFLTIHTQANFALNTCMLFFTLAGNFALFPPAVQRIFGPEQGIV